MGVVYHLPNLIADRQEQPNSNLQKSEILSMGSLLKSNLHIKESIDVRQRQFACRAALEAADGRQTPHRISREIAAGAIHCFPMPLATTGPCCLDFCVATQSVPGGLLPHALSTIATLLSTRTDFKE